MFNPAIASKNIKSEFIDYISTTFQFSEPIYQTRFTDELKKHISKGPFLEVKDIFKSGKSIEEMISDSACPLSPLFRNLEEGKPKDGLHKPKLPLNRPLYLHQEKAIRSIVSGYNTVISTGTGSGKTNCFLIPVLNELLREQEEGTLGQGIRAMFIYPMNALANDQMKNLREILMYYPEITFGTYTGNTENEESDAVSVYEAMFATDKVPELRHRLPNEILSREEMKKTPPNILFTNYAMLEHLLLRPGDNVLFSTADFRFVVLDEAHIYTGATGIETAILMRRLQARLATTQKTQFILTSATLGNDDSVDDDIVTFAENLCGVSFDKNHIIKAERERFLKSNSVKSYPVELYLQLADEKNYIGDVFERFGLSVDRTKDDKELLYDFLTGSDLYEIFQMNIRGVCELSQISKVLNISTEATVAFISLCTKAQKNRKSLIDARYHFFVRCLEGCYITLYGEKKLFLNRQQFDFQNNQKIAVFEAAACTECGRVALVGIIEENKLIQAKKIEDEVDYFYLSDDENDEIEDEDDLNETPKDKAEEYMLCPICGSCFPVNQNHPHYCDCGKEHYIKIVKAKKLKTGARCVNCRVGHYKRFYLGNDAATAVLATSLYEELPEIEYVENVEQSSPKRLFGQTLSNSKKVIRTNGRQFLTFSDSRQEAAGFACYLSKSYQEFLRRRGICQMIHENREDMILREYTISDFVSLLTSFFSNKKSFAKSNTDETNQTMECRKNAWVAMLNELVRYQSSTSLTSLGFLQFQYKGITKDLIRMVAGEYEVSPEKAEALLNLLVFEIVKMGAIYPDNDSDIGDDDREYIFYTPSQKFVTFEKAPDQKGTSVSNWAPRNKPGKADEYYKTSRLYYVCKFLNVTPKVGFDFLNDFFTYLTNSEYGNPCCMQDIKKDGTYVLRARDFIVNVNGSQNAHWYRCKKCGRITQLDLGCCPSIRCGGVIEEIDPIILSKDNHFARLYLSNRMSPLLIKEHTAQLSKKESAEYQEQFIKKEINALSCSTTFEMGVDVGDLETVFLRDVPPLPSNYAQRAGRAGRSLDAAAFVLTYAKLSSHDLSFYREPQKMIQGTILPPLFKLDNEKIVRRHVYAVALSMFFAENEDQYDHNKSENFINQNGYLTFIEWLHSKPQKLKEMLKISIPDINDLHNRIGIDDFSWVEDFCGESGVFTQLIEEYEQNIETFSKQIKQLLKENDYKGASICQTRLAHYKSNKLIDFLARGNILPRYGFPVNTVELQQKTTTGNAINRLRLTRDLQMAIAEYAPSSEVIADGRLYTSRYIKKSSIGKNRQDWFMGYIGICDNKNCKAINYSVTPILASGKKCTVCGKTLYKRNFFESIEPRGGFATEANSKDVPMTRPEKKYRSEDYYIGVGSKETKIIEKYRYQFNSTEVLAESTSNDSMLVKSYHNFYVCPQCGYTLAEDESVGDKVIEKEMKQGAVKIQMQKGHESLYGQYSCPCKDLLRRTLHHEFKTDVTKLTFLCDTSDKNTMLSVMYAILNAISKELNIERRDIKACLSGSLSEMDIMEYSIIIYDAVPGGAGHSRRIVTSDGKILQKILHSALNTMQSCKCDPSCYNCLRSYDNQRVHDLLDRHKAECFLTPLMGKVEVLPWDDESETLS